MGLPRLQAFEDQYQFVDLPHSWLDGDVPVLELYEVVQKSEVDLSLARRLVLTFFERSACQFKELLDEGLWPTPGAFGRGWSRSLTGTYPPLFLHKVKGPLVIEKMPGGSNSDSSGHGRQQFRQTVKVNDCSRQAEEVGVAEVELHLLGLGVHDCHYAQAQLRHVVWATMVSVLQVICTQVDSKKFLQVLETLLADLPLEEPADHLDADILRGR